MVRAIRAGGELDTIEKLAPCGSNHSLNQHLRYDPVREPLFAGYARDPLYVGWARPGLTVLA